LNLKENDNLVPCLFSKPDEFHCSNTNLMIKLELLLLLTKNGSDKFNVAIERDSLLANCGINKFYRHQLIL
jgi:hypothetical protein